jgi:hypothetical protein
VRSWMRHGGVPRRPMRPRSGCARSWASPRWRSSSSRARTRSSLWPELRRSLIRFDSILVTGFLPPEAARRRRLGCTRRQARCRFRSASTSTTAKRSFFPEAGKRSPRSRPGHPLRPALKRMRTTSPSTMTSHHRHRLSPINLCGCGRALRRLIQHQHHDEFLPSDQHHEQWRPRSEPQILPRYMFRILIERYLQVRCIWRSVRASYSVLGRKEDTSSFAALARWVPDVFVNPADPISSEYLGYFDHRRKMEEIGVGKVGRLATRHSVKDGCEPLHLFPSVVLTVNRGPSPDFKAAHGIHYWWRPN